MHGSGQRQNILKAIGEAVVWWEIGRSVECLARLFTLTRLIIDPTQRVFTHGVLSTAELSSAAASSKSPA